ncbi:hypothetical protein [Actinophytocola glycyrrhizae]|uniref:Uncharacterized protein n=1 Tax=Actinophytocola glycyrrhizae TaxID=2044873 RepID=A0ABV9SAC8_9PSEU
MCRALGVSAPLLMGLALQRARIYLDNLSVRVDLRALLADSTAEFRWMTMWAHNKLIQHPDGIVEIPPVAVRELATMIGSSHRDLAAYFTRFTPESDQISENEEDRV